LINTFERPAGHRQRCNTLPELLEMAVGTLRETTLPP
jgi:hypothetical protein